MRAVLVALLLGALASCDESEPGPAAASTSSVATASTERGGVLPEGFELGPAQVTLADGTVCELCLWRATRPEQRRRGLMGVTDLGPADGMVFVYDEPSASAFWMRDTPMPLSIAWFDPAGAFVSSAEMEPCLDRPAADCPRYPAAGPFTAAIELPAGQVRALGLGPGSVLELGAGAGCPPET